MSLTHSRRPAIASLIRTRTCAFNSCPTRYPSRLATTIRGTNPSTADQASWFGHPGAGGASETSRNVADINADAANPNQITRRVGRSPYTSARTSPSTYVSGKSSAPPSKIRPPSPTSLVALTLEINSNATNDTETMS